MGGGGLLLDGDGAEDGPAGVGAGGGLGTGVDQAAAGEGGFELDLEGHGEGLAGVCKGRAGGDDAALGVLDGG